MKNNQAGVSLVEVLATIVLLSIVLILSWSIFFQGSNYSNKSITKSHMQQEANIIVTKLKKIHQTSKSYQINKDTCSFIIFYNIADVGQVEEFKNDRLCIELSDIPTNLIQPAIENSTIPFKLTIKDIENLVDTTKQVEVNATLHRLKEVTTE